MPKAMPPPRPKITELDRDSHLLVLAGNEAQYTRYILELATRGILLGNNVRRCTTYRDIRGWRGPHTYYVITGTWEPTPTEHLTQLLHQCGIERIDD